MVDLPPEPPAALVQTAEVRQAAAPAPYTASQLRGGLRSELDYILPWTPVTLLTTGDQSYGSEGTLTYRFHCEQLKEDERERLAFCVDKLTGKTGQTDERGDIVYQLHDLGEAAYFALEIEPHATRSPKIIRLPMEKEVGQSWNNRGEESIKYNNNPRTAEAEREVNEWKTDQWLSSTSSSHRTPG